MIPRIKSIIDKNDYKLEVLFDDGRRVLYDVNEDINQIPDFKDLISIKGLWKQFALDESRTCVYWNDRIDLASDSIYEYGKIINSAKFVVTEECLEVTDAQIKTQQQPKNTGKMLFHAPFPTRKFYSKTKINRFSKCENAKNYDRYQ